ncbi:tetratricopeptide repeat protein, partial [uncultured Campylobacter sp.]|uniref:tetratricopeptide repeat protein n=1 Tax=uncultured Campylobacter sp. TaxID=218934 RepID=UPI00260BD425
DIFNEVFGSYYLEQNDLPKAKYYLSHALMVDGRMPDAQLGLARIAWMEHRPADAQRCLQRAVFAGYFHHRAGLAAGAICAKAPRRPRF